MARGFRKRVWTERPIPGAQVNRAHPLSQQLVGLVLSNERMGVTRELVRNVRLTTTTPTWSVSNKGITSSGWASSVVETDYLNWTSGPFTVAAWFRSDVSILNVGESPRIFTRDNYVSETSNTGWMLWGYQGNDKAGNFAVFNNNGLASYNLAAVTGIYVGDIFVVGTSDASTRRIFINGMEEASTTNSPTPTSNASVGLRGGIAAAGVTLPLYIGYCWDRVLTPNEIRWLYAEPYTLLLPPSPRIHYFNVPTAAAPANDLTSFVFTGW